MAHLPGAVGTGQAKPIVGALAESKEGTEFGRRNLEQSRDLADDGGG